MLVFLEAYWPSILIVLASINILGFLYKKGKIKTIKKIILSLVVQAEKALGSKTGELKYAMVIERLYSLLPLFVRLLFTRKEINNLIEDAVRFLKDYLDEERNLISYDDEHVKVLLDNINL